jgi:hypothetical protein
MDSVDVLGHPEKVRLVFKGKHVELLSGEAKDAD